jgi:hypothetical protein
MDMRDSKQEIMPVQVKSHFSESCVLLECCELWAFVLKSVIISILPSQRLLSTSSNINRFYHSKVHLVIYEVLFCLQFILRGIVLCN